VTSDSDELRLRQRLNADRRRRFGAAERMLGLLCECGEPDCHRTVMMTTEDYDSRPPAPIVHPEHALSEWPLLRDTDAAGEAGGSGLELRHDDEAVT